jgi:hypothetical protein
MRIDNRHVLFFLALLGAIGFLIPDELKWSAACGILILLFLIIPWRAYKLPVNHRIFRLTIAAQRTAIAGLTILWVGGILAPLAITTYAPPALERESGKSVQKLTALDPRQRPEFFVISQKARGLKKDQYVATRADTSITLVSAVDVYQDALDRSISPLRSYSMIFFFVAMAVFLFGILLINVLANLEENA